MALAEKGKSASLINLGVIGPEIIFHLGNPCLFNFFRILATILITQDDKVNDEPVEIGKLLSKAII